MMSVIVRLNRFGTSANSKLETSIVELRRRTAQMDHVDIHAARRARDEAEPEML